MRIPSAKIDQYLYFVAVDSADFVTRETGLTGFTVYRSRNGAAAVLWTTPTTTEVDATNMPGVYGLLIDEDTTIASTSDSEEYTVHITKAGMAPVTRSLEIYRRDTTTGRTLDVSAGGEAGLDWANIGSPTTAQNLSATNIDADQIVASVSGAVGSVTGLTASNLDAAVSTLATAANLATVAGYIDTEIGTLQTSVDDLPTNAELTTALGTADDSVLAQVALVKAKTDLIPAAPASTTNITAGVITTVTNLTNLPTIPADWITAAGIAADAGTEIATAVWASGTRVLTANTNLNDLNAAAVATAVWNAATATYGSAGSYGLLVETNLDGTVSSRASQTSVDTVDGIVDDILVDTAVIGAAGAGLTAVPWNAAWDAEVQSEVADAFAVYDPPTNAEMEARTIVSASYSLEATLTAMKGATFSGATDSLEAIRDRGDAAWITATGFSTLTQANVRTAVGLASANLDTQLATLATPAQVNAEVVDALSVDTYAQPGQGAPAASTSMKNMLAYLYKAWRNKTTQTATTYSLFNDDAATVDQKATTSDDATTFEKTEITTGP